MDAGGAMVRDAVAVWAPLGVALSVGGLTGIGAVSACEQLGIELSARMQAFPVIGLVVLFGFRGAVESAHRLAHLLRHRARREAGVRPAGAPSPGARA